MIREGPLIYLCNDFPLFENCHPITNLFDLLQQMVADKERLDFLSECINHIADITHSRWVHAACGFIQDQQRRHKQYCHTYAESLFHPSGKFACPSVGRLLKSNYVKNFVDPSSMQPWA